MGATTTTASRQYVNEFYSFDDFNAILTEIRAVRDEYKEHKHNLTIIQLCDYRDNLAILNSQLADIGADLFADKLATETNRRNFELDRREELEEELKSTIKASTVRRDQARYQAEREARELIDEENKAKAINMRAFNLYSVTIPKILDAMASRIGVLMRAMPLGTGTGMKPVDQMPAMNQFNEVESDSFNIHSMRSSGIEDLLDEI